MSYWPNVQLADENLHVYQMRIPLVLTYAHHQRLHLASPVQLQLILLSCLEANGGTYS